MASLTSRLAARERDLAIVRSRRREVEEQAGRKEKLPSAAKLLGRLEGKTYQEIAKELDLTKDHSLNCARITKLMEEAGLPEPYHRLTEKPDHVPQ